MVNKEMIKLVEKNKSVTLRELMERFQTSESTIRRDITILHSQGKLIKVFGGAVALEEQLKTADEAVATRAGVNQREKLMIARYAASIVKQDDFVYLDAGTTTGCMIDYLKEKNATYVTNGISHARHLSERGFQVFILGGELKSSTEAIVGSEALSCLEKYNFTLGFFGANGISTKAGFTTPDINEALIKRKAMEKTKRRYLLSDSQKFGIVSLVSFSPITNAVILTDYIPRESFKACDNIITIQ